MTMIPIWKICPNCKRKYDWNPDVGRMTCPYCLRKEQRKTVLGRIFRKKKNGDRDGDGSSTSKIQQIHVFCVELFSIISSKFCHLQNRTKKMCFYFGGGFKEIQQEIPEALASGLNCALWSTFSIKIKQKSIKKSGFLKNSTILYM